LLASSFFVALAIPEAQESQPDGETLNTIRQSFYVAVKDEATTVSLMNFIKDKFSNDHHQYPPVILAYYAALEGLRGRHASNPISKYLHVSKAINKMNEAVEKDFTFLEVRFLRFSFFHQIPGIFGVRNQVAADLKETIAMLEKRDYAFVGKKQQEDMIAYLLGTDELNPQQRSRLEQLTEEQRSTP
jgi:hypothetical protein